MTAVNFHAVESALFGAKSTVAELFDKFQHFFCCQRNGHVGTIGTGNCRRSSYFALVDLPACLTPTVIDLSKNFCAVFVDSGRQLGMTCYLLIIPKSGNVSEAASFGIHGIIFGNDESPAAAGFFFMIGDEAFRRLSVSSAVIRNHGRNSAPVFECCASDGDGAEKMVKHIFLRRTDAVN